MAQLTEEQRKARARKAAETRARYPRAGQAVQKKPPTEDDLGHVSGPWDKCRFSGCSKLVASGNKEKDPAKRWCKRHMPKAREEAGKQLNQQKVHKSWSDQRAPACLVKGFRKGRSCSIPWLILVGDLEVKLEHKACRLAASDKAEGTRCFHPGWRWCVVPHWSCLTREPGPSTLEDVERWERNVAYRREHGSNEAEISPARRLRGVTPETILLMKQMKGTPP